MKSLVLILSCLCVCSLSSCSLIGGILKIPGSILKTLGRTVTSIGPSGLTDDTPQPYVLDPEQQKSVTLEQDHASDLNSSSDEQSRD